jgi:X-Pro dipeptidyl-peptidase
MPAHPNRPARAPLAALVAVALLLVAVSPAAGTPTPKPGLLDGAALAATSLATPLATPPAAGSAGGEPIESLGVTGRSEPEYTQFVTESYEVPTPHGTIRGDVRRPVVPEGVQVPVILTYTPYSVLYQSLDPLRTSRADDATADYFAPRGYARAVFDVVGTFGSDGCTDFGGLGERETAAAVVDFLGGQPWSNGRVGMIGASYDGTTAIAAAVEAPTHLVTIVPQVAIDRWYDYMYDDGVRMTLEDNPTGLADPPADSPADYDLVYGVVPPVHQLADDPQGVAAVLADHARPCDRVENQTRGYETDPVYDAFWVERDYRALADRVEASVLLEGAWLDDNVKHEATTRFYQAMAARRMDPEDVDAPLVRMEIGQWSHSTSRFPDARDLRHAWFDRFLLGLDTGVDDLPPVDTQGSDGVRRLEDAWPPPGTTPTTFALGATTDGAPTFALTSSTAAWTDVDPAQTEEVIVGDACGPGCIRLVTEPLAEAVRIAGSPTLHAVLSTDATSTHLTPVLLHIAPDGTRRAITRGLLNSNQREGLDRRSPLTPGRPWSATVELWDVDHVVPAGHRLELVLASANATWGLADETRATSTLDLAASTITIPLVGDSGPVSPAGGG